MVFFGVSNNDTVEDGMQYRDAFAVPYALAHAPEVWSQFDVPYQPVTIVIGPSGDQITRVDGPITYENLKARLEELTS